MSDLWSNRFAANMLKALTLLVVILCLSCYLHYSGVWERTHGFSVNNVFFGGDAQRVIGDMTDPSFNHERTSAHPIFVLISQPICRVLMHLTGTGAFSASLLTALIAACALIVFAAILRRLDVSWLFVCLYTALLGTSSTFLVWGSVPDTHIWAGFGVLLALYLCLRYRERAAWPLLPVSVLSFGVNPVSLAAIVPLAAWRVKPAKVALVMLLTLATAIPLSLLQKHIYPSSLYWFAPRSYHEGEFFATRDPKFSWKTRPLIVGAHFAIADLTMPGVQVRRVTYSPMPLFVPRLKPTAAVAAWALVWVIAASLLIRWKNIPAAWIALALLTQFVFYSVYGRETFIFASNYAGLVMLLPALATKRIAEKSTSAQWLSSGLLVVLLILQTSANLHAMQTMTRTLISWT